MCAVWDLNGDGGTAGPGEGNYEAHSEYRFIQPAGTLFASKKKAISLCFGRGGAETSPVSACQSLARRVITEQSL